MHHGHSKLPKILLIYLENVIKSRDIVALFVSFPPPSPCHSRLSSLSSRSRSLASGLSRERERDRLVETFLIILTLEGPLF